MRIRLHTGPIDRVDTGTLVVGHYENDRPLVEAAGEIDWRAHGWLTRLLQDGRIDARFGSTLLLPAARLLARRVILVGLGERGRLDEEKARELAREVARKIAGLKETRAAIAFPGLDTAQARGVLNTVRHLDGLRELTAVVTPEVAADLADWHAITESDEPPEDEGETNDNEDNGRSEAETA